MLLLCTSLDLLTGLATPYRLGEKKQNTKNTTETRRQNAKVLFNIISKTSDSGRICNHSNYISLPCKGRIPPSHSLSLTGRTSKRLRACLSAAGRDGGVSITANKNSRARRRRQLPTSSAAGNTSCVGAGRRPHWRAALTGTPRREHAATQIADRLQTAAVLLPVASASTVCPFGPLTRLQRGVFLHLSTSHWIFSLCFILQHPSLFNTIVNTELHKTKKERLLNETYN